MKRFDWESVDWAMSNDDIAKHLNCSYLTVAKRRTEIGTHSTTTKPRSDRETLIARLKSPEMRQKAKIAAAAAQVSQGRKQCARKALAASAAQVASIATLRLQNKGGVSC